MKLYPTCHQPIEKGPQRIRFGCKQPIRRYDRWHFEQGRCIHNDCNDPSNQVEKAEVPERLLLEEWV